MNPLAAMLALPVELKGIFRWDPNALETTKVIFEKCKGEGAGGAAEFVRFHRLCLVSRSGHLWALNTLVDSVPGGLRRDVMEPVMNMLSNALDAVLVYSFDAMLMHGFQVASVAVQHRTHPPLLAVRVGEHGEWTDAAPRGALFDYFSDPSPEYGKATSALRRAFEKMRAEFDRANAVEDKDPLDGTSAEHMEAARRVLKEVGWPTPQEKR